jgi:hypothetical protein
VTGLVASVKSSTSGAPVSTAHGEREARRAAERPLRPGLVCPPAQQRQLARPGLAGPLQPLGDRQQQVVLDRAGAPEAADCREELLQIVCRRPRHEPMLSS